MANAAPAPIGSPEAARRLVGCRSRFWALSWKRIYGTVRLRLCTEPEACVFIPGAIIGRVFPDGDLAGDDRIGHRSRRVSDRRASHLARPDGLDKAPIDTPRRAMGDLLGHAVRFWCGGRSDGGGRRHRDDAVAQNGAAHYADGGGALGGASRPSCSPTPLRAGFYIARDNDPAGDGAMTTLIERANAAGIEAVVVFRAWATSTRIPAWLVWTASGQRPGCRSRPRTSHASWRWRHRPTGESQTAGSAVVGVARMILMSERTAPRPSRGRSASNGLDPQCLRRTIFPAALRAFPSRGKIARLRHPPLCSGPPPRCGQVRPARRLSSP